MMWCQCFYQGFLPIIVELNLKGDALETNMDGIRGQAF